MLCHKSSYQFSLDFVVGGTGTWGAGICVFSCLGSIPLSSIPLSLGEHFLILKPCGLGLARSIPNSRDKLGLHFSHLEYSILQATVTSSGRGKLTQTWPVRLKAKTLQELPFRILSYSLLCAWSYAGPPRGKSLLRAKPTQRKTELRKTEAYKERLLMISLEPLHPAMPKACQSCAPTHPFC